MRTALDATAVLAALSTDAELGDRLVHLERLAARPARYGEPAVPFHPEVRDRLTARKIERLFSHQAAAVDRLRAGESVALSTAASLRASRSATRLRSWSRC